VLGKVNDEVEKKKTTDNLEIRLQNTEKRTKIFTYLKNFFQLLNKKMMEIILEFELTLSFYNIAFETNSYQRKIFESLVIIRER